MKKLLTNITLFIIIATNNLVAKSKTELTGDILRVVIPLSSYGTTLYLDDTEGEYQFYKTATATTAMTYALKYSIDKERPDRSDNYSFPSGHASISFSSSTFIHKRYGFKYAIPAYLASAYTGYSRIYADKHHSEDVIVGAILGMGSSWYFTREYKNFEIIPVVMNDYQGFKLSYNW